MIELLQEERSVEHIPVAKIKVLGIGGAGGNTLNWMVEAGYHDVEFIAVNTDAQALQLSRAHHIIQIGHKSTKGLGAGANPEVGKRAAEEDLDKVLAAVQDADIVFLTGGLGGGTGSGALPVIAQALRDQGILTIVVVTKPFSFEGRRRATIADYALETIKECADTLLVIPNQNLLHLVNEKVSMIQAFQMINDVLNQCVRGIADIITRPGHINVDFADVREIMKNQGLAIMGTGRASGQNRAQEAAMKAISSPLLENMSIVGARGVLLNITGNSSLSLYEISAAANVIYEQADPDANIILGSVIDDSLDEEIFVTVIATGFGQQPQTQEIKNAASITIEPKKRDATSSYSFNHVPHKSAHPVSEHKNVAPSLSKNSPASTYVKEAQAPIRASQFASEIQHPQRFESAPQQAPIQRQEPRHEMRQEARQQQLRQEMKQEVQQENRYEQRKEARQEIHDLKEYSNPIRYEAVERREVKEQNVSAQYHTPLQQTQDFRETEAQILSHQQPVSQSSHDFTDLETVRISSQQAAHQEAPILQEAQAGSNDIETPAYLRKDNNQQFNWNKFNKKKKHKFQ